LIIKLLDTQIPKYSEVIKFAATSADEVDQEDLQPYLLKLIHALLNNKAQCWMRLDDSREIIAVLITRIIENKITAAKSLYLQCVYSYREIPLNIWREDFNMLIQFAKKENCKRITFESRHQRIWEITTSFGCREIHRSFAYDVR